MLARLARPAFVGACASNCALAMLGAVAITQHYPIATLLVAGAIASAIALASGFYLLMDTGAAHRSWIKAAIVLLVLGPLVFWGLQQPAVADTICLGGHRCYSAEATALHLRAVGDVIQSQWAMTAVALAALVCAARTMTGFLDELAL